jgi:predicted RNA-binding protein with PUA domain
MDESGANIGMSQNLILLLLVPLNMHKNWSVIVDEFIFWLLFFDNFFRKFSFKYCPYCPIVN